MRAKNDSQNSTVFYSPNPEIAKKGCKSLADPAGIANKAWICGVTANVNCDISGSIRRTETTETIKYPVCEVNLSTKVFMIRHLLKSNLLASKVHEIVLFLARTGDRKL